MKTYRLILIIGIIEILIGSITIFSNFLLILFSLNDKSGSVLLFVIVAGMISTLIGIGILKFKRLAYQLLLYFSSVIILSKLLIFMKVIQLNGHLEVSMHKALQLAVPSVFDAFMRNFKNLISIIYHGWILIFFSRNNIKQVFHH